MNQINEVTETGRKLNLKFVSEIIGEEYKKWHCGDIVLISAQTGTGKNYFVENVLIPNVGKKKFLLISNRTNLKREVKTRLLQKFNMDVPEGFDDLDIITTIENITITSYHALQHSAINEKYDHDKFDLSLFDYIILDEVHFILTDGSFNNLNRLTYEKLIRTYYPQAIRIFMSATMEEIKEPIIKCANKIIGKMPKIHEYNTGIDYSYVNPIYFQHKGHTETLINLIKNDTSDDKWLIFISNLVEGNKILEELGSEKCSIIKSQTKSAELTSIINDSIFKKKVLITTKAMDNGINIKDDLVKNIVILAWDKISLIQMLGRKRIDINNAQNVNLYLSTRSKKGFMGLIEKYNAKQAQVNLLSKDKNAFNKKYDNSLSKIYDDVIYKDNMTNEFMHNPIGHARLLKDKDFAIEMINLFNINRKFAFIHVQLHWLGIDNAFNEANLIEDVILDSKKQSLVEEIEKLFGEKVLKKDQETLKKLVTSEAYHIDRSLLQGTKKMHPNTFNSIMENTLKLPYQVEAKTTSKRVNGKPEKYTYWIISKIS